MRCEQIEKLLYLYQDNELNQKERKEVKEHIKICPKCSKKLADLKDIQEEVKTKQIPQPSEDYWESFAHRVKDKIEKRGKPSFGQKFSYFLKSIFSYSPAKIKWATAVASVVLVFVVVKLFMSYEKMDVTTIQKRSEVEKVFTPKKEAHKTVVKAPEEKKDIKISKEKEVVPDKEAPPERGEEAVGLASAIEKDAKKGEVADEKISIKKISGPLSTPRHIGYIETEEAPEVSTHYAPIITLGEKSPIQADVTTNVRDSLTQEQIARKMIDVLRGLTQKQSKGKEKDKGYLNMAQGYLKLYYVAENKDEILKEAIDSVKTYRNSAITKEYKEAIARILNQLQSIHKK